MVNRKDKKKQLISMNFDSSILEKVDKFTEGEPLIFTNRTTSIEYLTNVGLEIINRVKNTPALQFKNEMEEIYQQLKNGGLVDYLERISDSDLKMLFELINDENEIRQRKYLTKTKGNVPELKKVFYNK